MNNISTDLCLEDLADTTKLLNEPIQISNITESKENNETFKIEDNNIVELESINITNIIDNKDNLLSKDNLNIDILTSDKRIETENKRNDSIFTPVQCDTISSVVKDNYIYTEKKEIFTEKKDNLSIAEQRALKFKKMECLTKLLNIKNSGIELTRNYNMNSNLEDIEAELKYHTDMQTKKNSVQLAKNIMCNCITGLELLNEKYDPFGFKLSGWSDELKSNKEDFDEVFGELIDKYKGDSKKMEPELKLGMLLILSAGSFHVKQSLSTSIPALNDIIKNNPNLLNQIQSNINKTIVGETEQDKKKNMYANLKKMQEQETTKSLPKNIKKSSTSVKNLLKDIKKSIPMDSIVDSCSITVGNTVSRNRTT